MPVISSVLTQGRGLSPTLWSMIADSLLKWLSKRGVYAQGYADDGVVLVIGIVLSTVCEIMQRAVKSIEEWCTNHQQWLLIRLKHKWYYSQEDKR